MLFYFECRSVDFWCGPSYLYVDLTQRTERSDVKYQLVRLSLMLQLLGRVEQTAERSGVNKWRSGKVSLWCRI